MSILAIEYFPTTVTLFRPAARVHFIGGERHYIRCREMLNYMVSADGSRRMDGIIFCLN